MDPITPEEINAFHESAGASGECPFCKHTEWHLSKEAGMLLLTDLAEPPKINWKEGIPVVYLICTTCGFVRLQAIGAMRRMDDANDKKWA